MLAPHPPDTGRSLTADPLPSSTTADAAFRIHVVPEIEVLYSVAMRLTRDPHDAEDLVQDTLVRAFRAIDRFDGRHPRAWLLTILRNANLNRVRKRTPDMLDDEWRTLAALPAGGADGREGPAEAVAEDLGTQAVLEALRSLPAPQRGVVALVDIDGLSYREAAEVLGIPVGTVMSRLHRARARLRRHVGRPGSELGGPR